MILVACGLQRRWRRCAQVVLLAHLEEPVDVRLTVTLALKTWITLLFIHRLTVQICKPCLNTPRRDENCHALIRSSSVLPTLHRGVLNLHHTSCNATVVTVDHHDQQLPDPVATLPKISQFFGVLYPHELLSGPASSRARYYSQLSHDTAHALEKPPYESFLLPIFTQDDDINRSTQCSHPRAITSESLMPPSTASSREGRTTVMLELSRLNVRPLSGPR
jgi:hypothetical protein